ncbi:MAG: metalloregulator ArsR/SmtB family transcription factor [Casimicrobiaceae bacterium]
MKSTNAVAVSPSVNPRNSVRALAALAQETRLAIFRLLVEYEPLGLTPSAIALKLKLAPATLSFHLKELAHAGLLADQRQGRFIWYRADLSAMNELMAYLTEHCCRGTLAAGRNACGPVCAAAACGPVPSRTRSKR